MIAIIQYNAGNIRSVQNAVTRLGYDSIITDDPATIRAADKVILPGVGEASSAMRYLKARQLDQVILGLEQPVLGICLGLQLMCAYSEEGQVDCMGIFDTTVREFPKTAIVPHMGWNNFTKVSGPLFYDLNATDNVYFVHSYAAELCLNTTAICDYIQPFSAALTKNNFYAAQFHPEKSAGIGEQILQNFLSI